MGLWCVIDCDLVCMSFGNNYETNLCEMDGLGVFLYIGCCSGSF